MQKKYCLLYFALFVCTTVTSQVIKGKIQNELNEPISANILIKNSENKNLISEFFRADDKGQFLFTLNKQYSKIYFEVTAMGYEKSIDSIILPNKDKIYEFNFALKNNTTKLEEVIIKREKFKIEGDTTSFNPSSYKDGSEKKVEDLIRKIPEMEVLANGTIKYKGKNVTSVQLDGDDLFGYNYSIGTRNISVDMIQQIQAIDNFSENPLLNGIENSNNVSINLKLKKGKFDISTNGTFGSGFDSKINSKNEINLNLLGVSRKYKSFGNINYNNTGANNSSDDYFSMGNNLEEIQNQEFLAKKNISEKIFTSSFDAQRANINDQITSSYNIIYRFTKKISLKTNIYYLKDKISLLEENNILFNSESINYNDQTEFIKNPHNNKLELKLTYNINDSSLLEIENIIQNEKINTTNNIIQNQTENFNTSLNTKNFFWKNTLKYTNKINKNNAIQFISNSSINKVPQELKIFPTNFTFNGNLQSSAFEKKYFLNKLVLLGNSKKIKYTFIVGSTFEINPFKSNLELNNSNIYNFQNNLNYNKNTFFSEIGITYSFKKFKFQPLIKFNAIEQKYTNNINAFSLNKSSLVLLPNIGITYNINNNSTIKFSGNYDEKTPSEENLSTNYIAESNRFIKKNNFSLNLIKNQTYSLSYRFNNLLTSFSSNLAFFYDNKKNTFISIIDIQDDYTIFNSFQSPTNIESYSLHYSIEKYVNFLKTTIKHTSNFGINNYKNIINQSELRNNQSSNYNAYFFISTAFRLPFNIQNKFNYSTINFKTDNENSNTNISLNNSTKLTVKPNRFWFISVNYDYYIPNNQNKDKFSFLDFDVKYKPEKLKNLNFTLSGKNLLNNKFYTQTDNSDFQITQYRSSLMLKFYLLTIDFKF